MSCSPIALIKGKSTNTVVPAASSKIRRKAANNPVILFYLIVNVIPVQKLDHLTMV
jgi:hypothetical protein